MEASSINLGSLWALGMAVSLIYGVCIGSFLNVVIWRLPRGGSIASPAWSYCPSCQHRLGVADLVPLASFLAVGRRCRYCRQPISWRYFIVEALTGAGFAAIFWRFGFSWNTLFDILFFCVLVAVFFIDLDCFIIPDELNFAGVLIGLAHNLVSIWQHRPGQFTSLFGISWPNAIVGAIACALIFHAISFAGYLYYTSRAGLPRPLARIGVFWLGIVDDYAYLAAKFLCLGYLSARVRRYITQHEELPEDAQAPGKSREEIAAEIENEEEQTGMGQGDAKLAAAIGANLFLAVSVLSIFLSVCIGGVISIALLAARMARGRSAIPFGPYLVVGAVVCILFGQSLVNWYWHTFLRV